MAHDDITLSLVHQALDELDQPDARLTPVMRKAIRVARLRNDWDALYWLHFEMESYDDKEARRRLISEVAPYYDRDTFKQLHQRTLDQSIASRALAAFDADGKLDEDRLTGLSVPELEETIAARARSAADALPSNLHPMDAAHFLEQRRRARENAEFMDSQLRKVVARISQRVHTYLSSTERQLVFGQLQADVFEQNRRFVDQRLRDLGPEILDQLQTAYRRTREGSPEARSHALTSCRRALKSLADRLYPPRATLVKGLDGKERLLTDAMFVARLWQFVSEAKAGTAAKKILAAEVEQLGQQIDKLNELASKGVHDQVTEFEVNMCVLSTYSVAGALLRLRDEQSAATIDPSELR
jgi:hypothetical protein